MKKVFIVFFVILSVVRAEAETSVQTKITLKLINSPLNWTFQLISAVTGLNFSVSPEVSDVKITFFAKQKQLNKIRKAISLTTGVVIKKFEDFFVVLRAGKKYEPLEVFVYSPSFAEPKKLLEFVKPYLSGSGNASVWEGKLVVVDTPEKISLVSKMLREIDRKPVQYLIKAHIVEFSLNKGESFDSILQAFFDRGKIEVGEERMLWFSFTLSFDRITKILRTLAQKDKADILSSPSIVTPEGVPAKIIQGVSVPYFSQSLATGLEVGYVDATLTLDVTPLRYKDGKVRLKILLTRNAPAGQVQGFPIISKNEVHSDVVLELGKTIAIGGITTFENRFQRTGIPILSSLPIVGYLFGSTQKSVLKNQTVVFLTAFLFEGEEL